MAGGRELKLAISIGAKIDKSLGSAVNAAQAQLSKIGSGVGKVAKAITVATAAAGVKLIGDSIEAYTTYESSLAKTAATAGVEKGTAAYKKLDDAAREAGATTVKTAKESADALGYMALAGWSVEDSTKALMPILKLSAATGEDLAVTSDLVTDSMANLGLGVSDLNRYLNVATAANNKSNQSAMQLMEAYLGVGGVLNNLNSPIEESAAVLGVLANRGTKGSEAGTALNAILVNMQKKSGDSAKAMAKLGVSMYDAKGNARSILDVFQDISDKTSGMTEQQRNLMYQMIGGKSHLDSFAKIMQGFTTTSADGTKEVYSLVNAFQNCDGSLDKFYDTYTNTLSGSKEALSSAFEGMKIDIGEKLAPTITSFYKGITNNMPKIENVIMNIAEKAIPAVGKALDFLANNGDKVVSTAIAISKAFIGFKIGTGAINGINAIIMLVTNLKKIGSVAGIAATLKGVIGAMTGIGTAAGTAGGVVTAFAGGLLAIVGPMAAVVAGAVGLGVALAKVSEYMENKKYNYAEGMKEQADAIGKATEKLTKYNNIAMEVAKQREIIKNPESSVEQIENAKAKLQEIADMLGEEYNLVIHADTQSLDNAISKAQTLSRREVLEASNPFVEKVTNGAGQYKDDKIELPGLEKQKYALEEQQSAYSDLTEQVKYYYSELQNGNVTSQQYIDTMNDLYQSAKQYGYENGTLSDTITDWTGASNFANAMSGYLATTDKDLTGVNERITQINNNAQEMEEAAQKAGTYLTQALASDTQTGHALSIDTDTQKITQLGKGMVEAGISTRELGVQFAAAKAGYTDFTAAIGDGKAQEMVQNFLEYEKAIGESSETTVQGAALIANGFQNATAAATAGSDAVLAVINNMRSFGDMKGIFDGLDTAGVAAKLTEMAHAMQLIPDNKEIRITAEGAIEVADKVQQAANEIENTPLDATLDANINPGNINTSGMQDCINAAAAGNTQSPPPADIKQDVNVQAGNVDTSGLQSSIFGRLGSGTFGGGMTQNVNVAVNATDNASPALQAASTAINGMPQNKNISLTATGNAQSAANSSKAAIMAIPNERLTAINANDTASSKARAATAAIAAVPNAHDTKITASGNALSVATSVKSTIDNLPKSKTITINIKQNGSVPHMAAGTNDWHGGYTYLNDENVRDPREVIETPSGTKYWYEGKNIIAFVPKHSVIYPAAESQSIIDGSHRNGLERVPFDGYIAELHADEQVLTKDEADRYRSGGVFARAINKLRYTRSESGNDNDSTTDGGIVIHYSPNIVIEGDADESMINSALRSGYEQFTDYMERYERDRRRKSFTA